MRREGSWLEVEQAGRVLFGPAFAVAGSWRDDLRSAFRRRAFETHPDRAAALGREARELAQEFRELRDAFDVLSRCAALPPPEAGPHAPGARAPAARAAAAATRTWRRAARPGPPPAEAERPAGPSRAARPDARRASSRTPPRWPQRFGEFLYHTGRVPWSALVEAVAWQRRQRPPLGRIAVEFGFLTDDAVAELLLRRRRDLAFSVPLGEYAVRAGFLTPFQVLAALGRQRARQQRIGQFFVERGFIAAEEIDDIRREIFFHNARWGSGPAR